LISIKYFVGNFIAGFVSIGARRGLQGRHCEAGHAAMTNQLAVEFNWFGKKGK